MIINEKASTKNIVAQEIKFKCRKKLRKAIVKKLLTKSAQTMIVNINLNKYYRTYPIS